MTDKANIGHNSAAGDQLRTIVQQIERLDEEKARVSQDIREAYALAKGNGFDTKVLRKIIARRKRDRQELREEEELMQLYLHALGDLPLFVSDEAA